MQYCGEARSHDARVWAQRPVNEGSDLGELLRHLSLSAASVGLQSLS